MGDNDRFHLPRTDTDYAAFQRRYVGSRVASWTVVGTVVRVRLWRLRPTTLRVNVLLLLSARRATSADDLSHDMHIPHRVAVQLLTEFAQRGWLDFCGIWSSDSQMRNWYALTDAGWDEVRRHWPMVHRYRRRVRIGG